MDKVLIDGVEVTAEGIEQFTPQYGLDADSRTYTYSIGSPLIVRGDEAQILVSTFFSDCEGQQRSLPLRIYKECCGLWFDYVIKYEGTTYCESDCSVEFTPVRVTETTECFNYLNSTIYWKNGFIEAFDHPQIWYCNQPGFIQKALFLVAPIIIFILEVINTIIDVIEGICEVVTLSFGNCEIDRPDFLNSCNFIQYLTGCGRKVPSPLLREIFEYHATQCGLTFQSSVFQSAPYNNTALFQIQYERGRFNPVNWINANGGNLTVIQILDRLGEGGLMNLDYRIINGALVVERKDYFDALYDNIADISGLEYCMTFKDNNACSYGRYSYTDDALDQEANKAIEYTDDIIEFNPENADWKRGECTISAPFGRARFMFDHITGNDDDAFFSDYAVDSIRSGNLAINIFNPAAGLIATFVARSCGFNVRRFRDLIVHNDQASQFKLLVLEDGFDREDAKVIRQPITGVQFQKPGTFHWYNYPMSFREFMPDGTTPFNDGLYGRFHAIDNPNNVNREMFEIPSVEIPYTCAMARTVHNTQTGICISTPRGKGVPETAEIDFERQVVALSNVVVKCE
ncbi:MAG: hypothetical protein ACWA44_02410 [Thiotrichales bacterium]